MKYLIAAVPLSVGLLVFTSTGSAQHHGGYHGGYARHAPIHHGVYYGHSNWHHVVPHHPTYAGAYYTVGHNHYYTPSRVVSIVPAFAPPVVGAPPVAAAAAPVEVQRPVELAFGGYSRYEDLAGRLAFEANAMCLDMHYNYKHNKNFAEVYREAYDVLQAANYLVGKEHKGDRTVINQRMVAVDKLFHHVQDEMRGWTRAATKQVGVNTLPEKIEAVEAVLHHLCYDVGVKPHEQPAEAAPPGGIDEVAPPPPPIKP